AQHALLLPSDLDTSSRPITAVCPPGLRKGSDFSQPGSGRLEETKMTTQESVDRWKVLGFGPSPPIWSSRNIPCSWSTSPDRARARLGVAGFWQGLRGN